MQPDEMDEQIPPERAFWSYLDLVWLIGFVVAGLVMMTGIAAGVIYFRPELQQSGAFLMTAQFIIYAVVYAGFVFVFRIRHHRPVMESLGWRPSNMGVWTALGAGVLLAIAVQAFTILLKTPEKSPVEQFVNTPLSLTLVSITAVGLAPFFEETFFRGFIQPLLVRDLGAIAGIVITGCLFGGMHLFEYGNLWQYGVAISLVGIVLGYIRHRSGSIIPGIIVHACFNSLAVIGLIFTKLHKHL